MLRSKIVFSSLFLFAGAILISSCAYAAGESVQLQREATHINVVIGGQPFTTYYFDPSVAKPYFMPLRSSEGTIITHGFPIGNTVPPAHRHDPNLEPHQRPMYFGPRAGAWGLNSPTRSPRLADTSCLTTISKLPTL